MSLKQAVNRSDAEPRIKKMHGVQAGSHNGCRVPLADSDSEPGSDEGGGDHPSNGRVSPATLARFWSKVNKFGPVPSACPQLGNCWLWTANAVRGYGQFVLPRDASGQRHVYAHRFSYELIHGALPSSTIKACHHCDTPLCVRPSHLFAGTQAVNLDDARRKGRLIDGLGARRLSDAAYADILSAPNVYGNGVALAARYGVSEITISRIRNGHQGSVYRNSVLRNVERVPTVELPLYELRDLLQAPRQLHQPFQISKAHATQSAAVSHPVCSLKFGPRHQERV